MDTPPNSNHKPYLLRDDPMMSANSPASSVASSSSFLTDIFGRVASPATALWHLPSRMSPIAGRGGQSRNPMALSQIKAILNRTNVPLADRIYEVSSILFPPSTAATTQRGRQLSVPLKDLHAIFIVLIEDIFGSQTAQFPKDRTGWNLHSLTRTYNYHDFNAVHVFLGSSGPFMECIDVLMQDSECVYEYPVSRIPFHLGGRDTVTHQPRSTDFIMLSAFEYYIYHFLSLINQSSEWYQNALITSDSIYPTLFDDYLFCFLPMGGAHFKVRDNVPAQPQNSPQRTHSLLRSDVNLSFSPSGRTIFPNVSAETWRSKTFVDSVTNFWLRSWNEKLTEKRHLPRIPSGDVVRMVRLVVKHLHFFLNSFHPLHEDIKESVLHGLFRDFIENLFRFFENLIDHWPLDASFRLVIETWLSYIQPWRYKDPILEETEVGTFQSIVSGKFVTENMEFYDRLFIKVLGRFFRVDLTSYMNTIMLFRVAKVYSQDGLPEFLRQARPHHQISLNDSGLTSHQTNLGPTDVIALSNVVHLFDSDSKKILSNLVLKMAEAVLSLQERKHQFVETQANRQANKSLVTRIIKSLITDEPTTSDSEVQEIDRTLSNLAFVKQKFSQIFRLEADVSALERSILSSVAARSSVSNVTLLHDETTELTPQKRWDIVTRKSRYSPKFHGNPDEAPLRTDEFHFLARILLVLANVLNDRLAIEDIYYKEGILAAFIRQVCEPPTMYRRKQMHASGGRASFGLVRLPPRLVLRSLASHKAAAYCCIFACIAWMLGAPLSLKILFLLSTLWIVKLFVSSLLRSNHERPQNSGNRDQDFAD